MFLAYSGIFTTLDILRHICSHSGVFWQIRIYSESWHSHNMPTTLVSNPGSRYSRNHVTHASTPSMQSGHPGWHATHPTHISTDSTPFFKLPKEMTKYSGALPTYEEYGELTKDVGHYCWTRKIFQVKSSILIKILNICRCEQCKVPT